MFKWFACMTLLWFGGSAGAQDRLGNRLDSLYQPQVFQGMPCRVMKPLEFDGGMSYPVIVSLHGAGGRGIGNDKQLKDWNRQLAEEERRKDFPCYVVAPQANGLWNADHLNKIQSLIKTLPAVDMERIYLLGHSMGGHGTYIFIQMDPDYFAAAAPSAGSGRKTTEEFIDPKKIRDIPIWAFHGDEDRVCPFERDQEVFNALKRLGGNMKLTTWAGDKHNVSGKMIVGADNGSTAYSSDRCDREADFMTWLFSQSRSTRELIGPDEGSGKDVDADQAAIDQSRLVSGEYFITQSWSQEKMFQRPYYVSVPESPASESRVSDSRSNQRRFPVFMFLHGNGGNAKNAMDGFMRGHKEIASRYIMVFAQGYRKSWNIVSERSKADDLAFIEAIVLRLAKYPNVDPDNFSIMGASNGAALVNQLAIESKLPNVRNYISGVSPLNVWQYDGKQFKAKGDENNYRMVATPMSGKRLLNISGADDRLIPYHGGPSNVIPAKDGKLAFLAAEESTFVWARQMGYAGEQLTEPTQTIGDLEVFSYLDGDIVHCKVNNEGHGATRRVGEAMLLGFLRGDDVARRP